MTDTRERGPWRQTPGWMFWRLAYRRPIYAHWQIGGGVDEWEYASDRPALYIHERPEGK